MPKDATEYAQRRCLNGWPRPTAMPANKGMKLTKPSILELRSLSPVLGRPVARRRNGLGWRCDGPTPAARAGQQPSSARRACARRSARPLGVAWLGPEPPRSPARREPRSPTALPLLKLKARRSSATRSLSSAGDRGFQGPSEGVALQRRLCLANAAIAEPACPASALPCLRWLGGADSRLTGPATLGGTARLPNKGMKLTKPSVLELRSLSLCSTDVVGGRRA